MKAGGFVATHRTKAAMAGWARSVSGDAQRVAISRSVSSAWILRWQIRWIHPCSRPPSLFGRQWWRLTDGPATMSRPQSGQGPSEKGPVEGP